MSAWQQIDLWRNEESNRYLERLAQLARFGWLLMPSDDGLFWARRIRPEDVPGGPIEGRPEAKGPTYELLLAEVRAKAGRPGGRA